MKNQFYSGNKNIYSSKNNFMQSQKFSLNKEDLTKIGKVFLWLLASTIVSFLITLLPQIDAGNLAWLIPIINIGLVSAKKFIEDNR